MNYQLYGEEKTNIITCSNCKTKCKRKFPDGEIADKFYFACQSDLDWNATTE